jgi:hypothetical protein
MAITLDGSAGITLPASGNIFNASLIKSDTTSPPTIQDSNGTEIGTFCRAWVNFNGTGTVDDRAAFNVSSITDNGVGDYTVNFTTAMPDVNYSSVISTSPAYTVTRTCSVQLASTGAATEIAPTTSQFRFSTAAGNVTAGAAFDAKYICASFFR